jgi:hypothetical protein
MGKRKASSEGVRRLSITVAILTTIASLFITGAILIPNSNSALVLLPVLIGSAVIGGIAWGLVRLVAGTRGGKQGMSAEGRARISAAMKKRWAAQRKKSKD